MGLKGRRWAGWRKGNFIVIWVQNLNIKSFSMSLFVSWSLLIMCVISWVEILVTLDCKRHDVQTFYSSLFLVHNMSPGNICSVSGDGRRGTFVDQGGLLGKVPCLLWLWCRHSSGTVGEWEEMGAGMGKGICIFKEIWSWVGDGSDVAGFERGYDQQVSSRIDHRERR